MNGRRDAAAYAGERSGSRAERDAVEFARAQVVPAQQLVHHPDQQLGVPLPGEQRPKLNVSRPSTAARSMNAQ